jgi:hypothetical protein
MLVLGVVMDETIPLIFAALGLWHVEQANSPYRPVGIPHPPFDAHFVDPVVTEL